MRRAAAAGVVALALLGASPGSDAAVRTRVTSPSRTVLTTRPGTTLHRMINRERAKLRRSPLRWHRTLWRVAYRHSRHMAGTNRLHHNEDLARELRYVSWRIVGENVGVGSSVNSLHTAFMNSAPHRRNVLDRRFRRVGIGVHYARGRTWVTVVFMG